MSGRYLTERPALSFAGNNSYRHSFIIRTGGLLDGQNIETPRMDNGLSSHVEGTCEKEKTSGKHRQNSKANCGRDAAKSI
jgi:hypothetical protein